MVEKKSKTGFKQEYRFMVGVLDTKTHSNIFYAKNLNLENFDRVVKEMRRKFK